MHLDKQLLEIRQLTNNVTSKKSKYDDMKAFSEKRKGRCVTFGPLVRLKEIQHVNDLPDEEIRNTWYTPEEYAAMKTEIKVTLVLAEMGELFGEESAQYCMRGLECRTKRGSQLRKTNRLNSIEAVLYEQSRQFYQGSLASPEELARVYMDITYRCGKAALRAGLKDAARVLDLPPQK